MTTRPTELTLTLAPQRRFEAIDVNKRIAQQAGDLLRRHRRALYTSFHTTAGYLDQSLSVRLHHDEVVAILPRVPRALSRKAANTATTRCTCAPS